MTARRALAALLSLALPAVVSAQVPAPAQPDSAAAASQSVSFGLATGASIPGGDYSGFLSTGLTLVGSAETAAAGTPFLWRGELELGFYGVQGGGANVTDGSLRLNVVRPFSKSSLHPYAIGGLGLYDLTVSNGFEQASVERLGINFGGGVALKLGALPARLELRVHYIAGESAEFIPLTFGVSY